MRIASFRVWLALAAVSHMIGLANAQLIQSASFQQGTNGYAGSFERFISSDAEDHALGAEAASIYVDGYNSSSPDTQALIRFDDLFGTGAGQIPSGATILDAHLTITTSLAGNAHTGGPYGVAALLEPFDQETEYLDYFANDEAEIFSRGPWWQDDSATRPASGFGFQSPGNSHAASITSIVQAWSDGELDNNGLVIQAGRNSTDASTLNTSDGWSFRTSGYPIPSQRPLLEVEYTTADVKWTSFQDGANDYDGTTMAFVRSGSNALVEDTDHPDAPEVTEDAFDFEQAFLDGLRFTDVDGNNNSPDEFAILQFGGVFGDDSSQAPARCSGGESLGRIDDG